MEIPRTEEEFRYWMIEKVGEIQTSQASLDGRIDTALANHDALVERVAVIEHDSRIAKYWENGKVLAGVVVSALIHGGHK